VSPHVLWAPVGLVALGAEYSGRFGPGGGLGDGGKGHTERLSDTGLHVIKRATLPGCDHEMSGQRRNP